MKSPVSVTVNGTDALPLGPLTTSAPVVAPSGTVVVIWLAVSVWMSAGVPSKATVVAPGSKFAPAIVTNVPIGPLPGDTLEIAGPSRTVNV